MYVEDLIMTPRIKILAAVVAAINISENTMKLYPSNSAQLYQSKRRKEKIADYTICKFRSESR